MAGRGVHFAINDEQLARLRSETSDDGRWDYLNNVIEEDWQTNFGTETDKAWGLIHQTLIGANPCADQLGSSVDREPLGLAILGDEAIGGTDIGTIGLLAKRRVAEVRDALDAVTEEQFALRLRDLIERHGCSGLGDEDVEYASYWFENLKSVYRAAAARDRHIIFSVDW